MPFRVFLHFRLFRTHPLASREKLNLCPCRVSLAQATPPPELEGESQANVIIAPKPVMSRTYNLNALKLNENYEFLSRRVAACLLMALPVLYFFSAVIGKILLAPGDGWVQNYPLRTLLGQMLARGEFPLWNPYIFGGMPLLATVYPGAAYPPNWLFALLPPGIAMNFVVITTYHIALIGSYRLGRAFGWQRNASLCLAITFSFSAFMLTHLGHTSRIAAAAWLPWVILAIEKLAHQVTSRQVTLRQVTLRQVTLHWTTLGALAVGLQMLAGEPQMWMHTILLATAYVTWKFSYSRQRRLLLAYAAMLLGGVCLSAVQWLPALELIAYGERAAMTYEAFTSYALPPRQIAAFWLPFFAGGASTGPYQMPYVYWGEWSAVVTCGYVGMLAWLLAFVALWRRDNSESNTIRSVVWFWFGVACISLLLAMGDNVPGGLQRILFRVPGYNVFRGPYRHLLEFALALAVLAGYGWQRLTTSSLAYRRQLLARAALLLTAIVLTAGAAYIWLTPGLFPTAAKTYFTDANITIPFACLAGSLIAAYWYWGVLQTPPRWIAVAILTWLIIDLAFYGHFFYWRDSPYQMQARTADTAVTKAIKARETNAHDYRVITQYRFSDKPDWALDAELLNYPNNSLLRGLHSLNGYDVLRVTRFERLLEQDAAGMSQAEATFAPTHLGLDILNAKYAIYSNALKPPPAARWRFLNNFGPVSLYENLNVLPRAWLVTDAYNLPSADVLRTLQTGTLPNGRPFEPRRMALFSNRNLPPLSQGPEDDRLQAHVEIAKYEEQRIRLNVVAPGARWLVMSEVNYPGWEAWLDGKRISSFRANYLLRAVEITAGRHTVEFFYRPRSFQSGLLLSLIILAIVLSAQLYVRNASYHRRDSENL
jgi:hypothetical protein